MSDVHDTITEALDRYHALDEQIGRCDCGWYYGTPNEGGETYNEHLATAAIDALSAAGFVVRKQVEPEAAKNAETSMQSHRQHNPGHVASALVAAWNAGFIEGRRP